jgi:TubC N-terminal docking domain
VTAATLVAELRARGVVLEPHGDRLRVRPASIVTTDETDLIRRHKTEILRLLHTEDWMHVPPADPETVREVLGANPTAADRDALHHELASAVWDLRERQAGRQPWGGVLLVRGRPLADWLSLDTIADLLRGSPLRERHQL